MLFVFSLFFTCFRKIVIVFFLFCFPVVVVIEKIQMLQLLWVIVVSILAFKRQLNKNKYSV